MKFSSQWTKLIEVRWIIKEEGIAKVLNTLWFPNFLKCCTGPSGEQ